MLLVLDNVWRGEHVDPFRSALGRRCQMLITSRDAGMAARLGATLVPLDLLSEEESRRLLSDWVAPCELPATATEIADECGRLPFGLALVGAMAAAGTPWHDLLAALRGADLAFMRTKLPDYEHADLLRAQHVSVEFMRRSADEVLRRAAEKYLGIAAFRWEQPVPEGAILTRWQAFGDAEERRARQTLTTLGNMALLRVEGEAPNRRVSLHDLQQDYLVASTPDMRTAHGAILDAYRRRFPDAPFGATDDGYYFDSLFHHLGKTERHEEMHAILRREDEDGGNAWWKQRLARGQVYGYEDDIWRAALDAQRAALETPSNPNAAAVARVIRYALMIGSIHDAVVKVPSEMVEVLLAFKLWTPQQALTAARWNPNPFDRAATLSAVLPRLVGSERAEMLDDLLALIATFADPSDAVRFLLPVAERLAGESRVRVLRQIVDRARTDFAWRRVDALVHAWALHREASEWLEEAMQLLAEDEKAVRPPFALASFGPLLPAEYQPKILGLVRRMLAPGDRIRTLLVLAGAAEPRRRATLAAEAYEELSRYDVYDRLVVLCRITSLLSGEERRRAVREVAQTLGAVGSADEPLVTLAAALPLLDDPQRSALLIRLKARLEEEDSAYVAWLIVNELVRPGGLREVDPSAVNALFDGLLGATRRAAKIELPGVVARAFAALLPLVDPGRAAALVAEEARRPTLIPDQWLRMRCLTVLCEWLEVNRRGAVIGELVRMANVWEEKLSTAAEVPALLRMASLHQLQRASKVALDDDEYATRAAGFAIGFATHEKWGRVTDLIERIDSTDLLRNTLKHLGDVPPKVACKIIDWSLGASPALGAVATSALIGRLHGRDREKRLKKAMVVLDKLTDKSDRVQYAYELLPNLSCPSVNVVHRRFVEHKDWFGEDTDRLRARLGARLVECGRPGEAEWVLTDMHHKDTQAESLAEIAAIAGEHQPRFMELAEAAAGNYDWPESTVRVLVRLASLASRKERDRLLGKAWRIMEGIDGGDGSREFTNAEQQKTRAITELLPMMPDERRRKHVLDAWRLMPKGDTIWQYRELRRLSPSLAALSVEDLLEPWLSDVVASSAHRADVLGDVSATPEILFRLGGAAAVDQVVTAIEDVARWWPDTD